jgi:hypothetical protein
VVQSVEPLANFILDATVLDLAKEDRLPPCTGEIALIDRHA